jgi:hypothetical protein
MVAERVLSERGGVLVTFAIWLPVAVLLAVFVIDVGDWFLHKRHLQMQVDAGALAAGGSYTIPCSDAPVVATARQYSGDPNSSGAYNPQVLPTSQGVHVLVNSSAYWNQGGSDYSDGGTPCTDKWVDLKATESNLPLFFSSVVPGLPFVPAINAHARVEIRQKTRSYGLLPVAVSDVNPVSGVVTFVGATGAPLSGCSQGGVSLPKCTIPLARSGLANGLALWGSSASVSVPVGTSDVGVRLAFSGALTPLCTTTCASTVSAEGGSAICSQPLIDCYELDTSTAPLHIPKSTSGALQSAVLLPGPGCSDQYFSSDLMPCSSVVLGAHFNFSQPNKQTVTASDDAGGCSSCALTYQSGDYWQSAPIAIPAGFGLDSFSLAWAKKSGCTGSCSSGSLAKVQYTYTAGDTLTGPVKLFQLHDNGNGTFGISVGLLPSLADAQSVSDHVVTLRLAKANGAQVKTLDCDPSQANLRSELANGCNPTYRIDSNPAVDCSSMSPQTMYNTPQPWPCVSIQPGASVGQVTQGMQDRILAGGTCAQHPNNWSSFPNFNPNDTRIVEVIVTGLGSFSGNGSNYLVPITNLANFYVTGWGGNGNGTSCPGDDPAPTGDIVGHFIHYVSRINKGGGDQPCDFNAFGSCVAVLTQ